MYFFSIFDKITLNSPYMNHCLKICILLVFLVVQSVYSQQQNINLTPEKPSYNYSSCEFQAIGHRGYSDIYPENTLIALEEAFKRGVKYCEIDVNVTSDDVYVLFHDQPTMYRTSNGNSYVVSETYQELLKLDVGSWKGYQFTGTKIATLEEAVLLAEKYDAHLYLDTKKFRPDLMGKILMKTMVNPNRIMPAIANKEEALAFRKYCPNSPWVYFGFLPKNVEDDNWYKEFVDLGCVVFETYYTFALKNDQDFQTFVSKAHQYGAKVWVFTSNDLNEINKIYSVGVDGVESDVAISALKVLCDKQKINLSPLKLTTANYTFDNRNLQSTGIGSQLRPLNYSDIKLLQNVDFGTTDEFGIKPINGEVATVMKVPAFNPKNGLFLFTNFSPGIYEELHFEYSLMMDVYIPKKSEGKFISLMQTNPENENDGDLFISPKGIGIDGNYQGQFKSETWNRIVMVVTEKGIKKYINGTFIGETPITGGRWSVINTFPGGQNQGFLLFADDDNETSELYVNAIQLRNYPMSETEVLNLSGPKHKGFPISNTGIYDLKVEGEIKPSIVNWDKKEIYLTLPESVDLSKIIMTFKLPYGATSNLLSGTTVDLTIDKNRSIIVTAQDGISKTNWLLNIKFQ